jgi:raffinose/stachyose/melibiose transport system substrate-binding protein
MSGTDERASATARATAALINRRTLLSGLAAGGFATIAACAPGSSNSSGSTPSASSSAGASAAASPVTSVNPSTAGKITLTEWDQNTGTTGIGLAQVELNNAFMKKYPNVKIVRNDQSFADLKTTLKLALSSNNPPDVVQANQGYPDMGAFVAADLLQPVDKWAALYGWKTRFPSALLDLNSFSADGKTFDSGNLYGVSQTGEIVGVYYNKKILSALGVAVPKTLDDFTAAMKAVKAKGKLPLEYGDSSKSPGIHLMGIVQAALAGATEVRNLVFDRGGAKWTDATTLKSAEVMQGWAKANYLTSGFNGKSDDDALADFGKGSAAFYVSGTWQLASLSTALGTDVGFLVLSGVGGKSVTQGGEGLAWAMTSKTKNPDVAAAYIDFITNAAASTVLADTGNLPAVPPASYKPKAGTLAADILTEWNTISSTDGLVPYLDYATTTFYNTLSAGMQELLAGQQSPAQFTQALQADYAAFTADK